MIMTVDWNQVRENNRKSEAERRDREAIEGARLNHKLSESEAAFLVGRRKFEAAEREQQEHTRDQLAFANHALNRAVEAKKQGRDDDSKTWLDAFGAINAGNWPVSRLVQSDPHVMKFASLRTRLNYAGKNTMV
jgi:hypothetical protein